ncbi:MAG: PHB depolymerase family esterase [bacterium]
MFSPIVRDVRRSVAVLGVVSLTACVTWGIPRRSAPSPEPGTAQLEMRVDGVARSYLLHVPPRRPRRFGRAEPYPLLIVLHGSGASGQTVRQMSHLDSLADVAGAIVAYPDATRNWLGLQSGWNAGACCGAAARNQVNDIGFLRALVAHVETGLPIDRRRVYVAGFSDGARMAYRAGCELSTEIAAIAVVAGSLVAPSCSPVRPVPLIAFHGTADDQVDFGDGSLSVSGRPAVAVAVPIPPAVQFWASTNDCQRASVTTPSPSVVRTTYAGCAAEVVFYAIRDGGHAWPGGDADGDDGDPPTREMSASTEIMRFFLRHSLR